MKVIRGSITLFLLFVATSILVVSCASKVQTEGNPTKVVEAGSNVLVLTERFVFNGHTRGVQGLSFNSDSTRLASGGWDNHIFVWDPEGGTQLTQILDAHESDVISLDYDTNGSKIVSAGLDKTIRVWDGDTGELIKKFGGFKHNVIGVDVYTGAENTYIAAAVLTGEIIVLNYETGERIAQFWHDSYATNVSFSPDGTLLASTGNDKVIRIWDLEKQEQVQVLVGHTAKVNTVAFSPDGTKIVSGAWDNTVHVWDVADGSSVFVFEGHTDSVEQVQYSPSGAYIVSGARDGYVNIIDSETGSSIVNYDTGSTRVYNVVFNRDASKIAISGYDHSVRVYDITK